MAHNVSHQSQLDSRSLLLTGKMPNCKKEEEVNMLSPTDWCWGNGLLTIIHSTSKGTRSWSSSYYYIQLSWCWLSPNGPVCRKYVVLYDTSVLLRIATGTTLWGKLLKIQWILVKSNVSTILGLRYLYSDAHRFQSQMLELLFYFLSCLIT